MGSLEEGGELPSRTHGRGPLRPLQVHVSATGARRLSFSPGTDSRLGHLRPFHTSPLTHPRRLGAAPADSGGLAEAGKRAERSRRRPRPGKGADIEGANGWLPCWPWEPGRSPLLSRKLRVLPASSRHRHRRRTRRRGPRWPPEQQARLRSKGFCARVAFETPFHARN
jgi:hypothetical protein